MIQITLTKDKDTKNAVRFTTQNGPITGSLYVPKADDRSKNETLSIEVSEA